MANGACGCHCLQIFTFHSLQSATKCTRGATPHDMSSHTLANVRE